MGNLLGQYSVMQRNTWTTRTFYMAQDRRTGQVVYLIEEPASRSPRGYEHPSLPSVQQVAVEAGVRWLRGPLPDGESLEDLRAKAELTEQDIAAALLSVIDGLSSLGRLEPALIPAYLDPACIRKDRAGRWMLDYLALAHATEARMTPSLPLGVHPVGLLLYWLLTGESARRTRVQSTRLSGDVAATLQFIVVKSLGLSYPGLAELRADIERAGQEHAFRSVVQMLSRELERRVQPPPEPALLRRANPGARAARLPVTVIPAVSDEPHPAVQAEPGPGPAPAGGPGTGLGTGRLRAGGPQIPPDDRPWAAPPKPSEGYRRYVVPTQPRPRRQRRKPWRGLAAVGLLTLVAGAGVALKLGYVPRAVRGVVAAIRPAASPGKGAVSGTGQAAGAGAVASPAVAAETPPPDDTRSASAKPGSAGSAPAGTQPGAAKPGTAPPATQPGSTTQPSSKPGGPPDPQPGSIAYQDMRAGGAAAQVFLDRRSLGYAWVFPNPRTPFLSLGAFNSLFGRTLYWTPAEGGTVRIYTSDRNFFTNDYQLVDGRLWLKLSPALLQSLGLQLQSATPGEIYITSR